MMEAKIRTLWKNRHFPSEIRIIVTAIAKRSTTMVFPYYWSPINNACQSAAFIGTSAL
jgi:hypothetical protein